MVNMSGKTFFAPDHEIHSRRFSRNLGLGLTLVAFVALVFGLTMVKVTNGIVTPQFENTATSPERQP